MKAALEMPALREMRPFDSCVTLGRIVYTKCPECLPTAESVLAMMDRYGIAEALVHSHEARVVVPREFGNRELLEAVRGVPRLKPSWVLEPPKRPGKDAARKVVAEMLGAGVKAARLLMKVAPPLPWFWDDLCSALEEHRVPCFLDFGDVGTTGALTDENVNGIREIALAHPELPLILSQVFGGLGVHHAVVPLIRRVANVHLDIAGILDYWREAAAEAGPDRVFFATGAPFADPGIYISNIHYATGLDEKAKKMMYGDNLRNLLERVR